MLKRPRSSSNRFSGVLFIACQAKAAKHRTGVPIKTDSLRHRWPANRRSRLGGYPASTSPPNLSKTFQRCLQVLGDFRCQDVRFRQAVVF